MVFVLGLAVAPTLAAQEPLMLPGSGTMEGKLVTDENRLVSFQWFARRGYEYTVRTSVDLEIWLDVGNYYGAGATVSLPVYQIPDPVTGAGGTPQIEMRSAYFTLRHFEGVAKTLVTWKEPGVAAPIMVVVPYNFSNVGALPLFLDIHDEPSSGVRYDLAFSTAPGIWSPELDSHTISLLPTEQQEKLSWFTGRQATIDTAMLAAGDPPGVVAAPAVTGAGAHHFIVCSENTVDSDGDGLFDHFEILYDTDWARADSDGDGVSDYLEILGGSNPNDPTSLPPISPPDELDPEKDDDKDGLLNGVDFDPLDPNINWPKTAPPSYALIQIPGATDMTAVAINGKGQVLLNGKDKDPAQTLSVFVWSPGDTQPVKFPKGSVAIEISKPDAEGNLVTTDYPITGSAGTDISDTGVVVGYGLFNATGTPPANTGSAGTSPPSVALRWAGVGATAVLLHPGKERIDDTVGDLVLYSRATLVNNIGDIIGYANTRYNDPALTPADTSVSLPTRWKTTQTESLGEPIYTPAPTAELPENKREFTIARLYENIFFLTGSYREGPGSPEIPALWPRWQAAPDNLFAGLRHHRVGCAPHPAWTFERPYQ
jgi:hypothetical protein